jgi:pimeloyl-ACP methyl ester carboxylesterase
MANPVVVIPGYYGSKLAEASNKTLVWLNSLGLLNGEITLEALRLDKGDPNRVISIGILDEVMILPFFAPDVYKSLTRFLRTNLELDVFEFHYDWRKPLESAADRLLDQLFRLRQAGAQEVDLVTHSLGGLVARAYLQKHGQNPNVPKVKRLVTMGCPHKAC